jgi:hypothetical protein
MSEQIDKALQQLRTDAEWLEKRAIRARMSDTELMQATEEAEESVKGFIRRHIEPSQQATPRPWRVTPAYQGPLTDKFKSTPFAIGGADGFEPCLILGDGKLNAGTAEANAQLIVTAVNAHDALVAAIKEAVRRIPYLDANLDVIKQCDAALTLAKSTEQDNGDPSSEPGHPDNPRSNYDEVRDRL